MGGDNDVDMDDEEQEVILDLTHIDKTRQGEGHGPASHARFAMDQHQRYLEAVIGEHKVKVERGGEEKAREALVVDLVSGDEDDLDIDSQGKARGNNIDAHVNNDDDDDNDDEYDDGVDTGRNGGKYMDEDIDDDFILYGNSRRDSGIEEKSEHSAILSGKGSNSLFNPMIFDGTGNGSYKTGADGGVNKYGRNGLHPTLSYSSSSDTDKPPRKRRGDHPRKSTSTPAVNGRLLDKLDCKATTEPADKSVAIRNVIENSGGIRVFPPGPDTKSSLMNGSAQRENSADAQLLAERGSGVGRDSTAPEPLPRGSPPVRHLRSLKAPQAYSDFKNGLHARESDLESFVELTDL